MKRLRPSEWAAVAALMLLLAAILFPVQTGRGPARRTACISNLKQVATSTLIYCGDFDEHYPLRDRWVDELVVYAKRDDLFHCPVVPKGAYGYAFDSRLSGTRSPKNPSRTTMIFDSVNPIRNASDPLLSLPNPGRHPDRSGVNKAGFNNFAFADGHTKAIPGEMLP